MASYKVPQDVEADDKLLGPFSFRQFVYLMIVLGMVVLGVALFKIFPLLIIIPIPIGLFFLILALPLKKDQPMETYLAAILSFYFKPRKRFWMPGQSESTILITAPKKVEASRVRDITEEEAGHRLSFLSAIVDSEGYAIHSANSSMRDEIYAEAYNTADMFDYSGNARLSSMINREQQARHEEAVKQMRAAIQSTEANRNLGAQNTHTLQPHVTPTTKPELRTTSGWNPNTVVQPTPTPTITPAQAEKFENLANNPDYSVETIQQEANRIQRENESEVYISLH